MRWSYFFLAEYASMFAVSGLAALLFCGGWHTGFLPFEPAERFGFWLGNLLNVAVFTGKGSLGVLVMMWMRWSLPRLRIDQVMMTCLKYFLPISCVLLVGVCAWQLFVPAAVGAGVRYVLAFGSAAFVLAVVISAFALRGAGTAPAGELAGVWAKPTPAGKG
jgi:NADH-quinone oxidoreductase subunit H